MAPNRQYIADLGAFSLVYTQYNADLLDFHHFNQF